MDNSYLSSHNIDNIYEYINAEMVKNYNINLNDDVKNKKIVKKLTKTVFEKVNNDLAINDSKQNILVNSFNEMVIKKCVPFLLKNINGNTSSTKKMLSGNSNGSVNGSPKLEKRKKKYSIKKNQGIKNFNLKIGEPAKPKKKTDPLASTFHEYINDADDFEKLVKESNKQINDSFRAYSEKQSVFNSHDSITDLFNQESLTSSLINERCAIKDDISGKKLDTNAFNKIMAQTILKNSDEGDSSTNSSKGTGSDNRAISGTSAYSNYEQMNVRELLSKVLLKQTDHSNNELESYEGELYLPNLIREVGEEAPIQPLLFQNTTQGNERIHTKMITVDTGDYGGDNGKLDLTTIGTPKAVTNLGTNRWYKFRINLQETFKIEKLTDIYVKSFTLVGATTMANAQYFVLNIEEVNIIRPSNNKHIKNKLIFKNTNSSDTAGQVVSHTYGHKVFFLASINPTTLYNLNFELTNENNKHADSSEGPDNLTFKDADGSTNRITLELEFIPRGKPNDIIFDRTQYGAALNAELSNS